MAVYNVILINNGTVVFIQVLISFHYEAPIAHFKLATCFSYNYYVHACDYISGGNNLVFVVVPLPLLSS